MKLINCVNPQRIYNKYSNEWLYVPCGKCDICHNTKNAAWTGRLMQEMTLWPYVSFFFLSYDPKYVPFMEYDNIINALVNHKDGTFVQLEHLSKNENRYLELRGGQPVSSKTDIQKFIKRFRYHYSNYVKQFNENEKILYYIVSEQGPTTLYPHYHGLLFSNSKHGFANIIEILSKSWKMGFVNSTPARTTAPHYVAAYLNSITDLPSFFESSEIKPFKLNSTSKIIGSLPQDSEEVRKEIVNGVVEHRVFDRKSNKYLYVPLYKSIENRLFPKLPRFGAISSSYRKSLLRSYAKRIKEERISFDRFQQIIFDLPKSSSDYKYFDDILNLNEDVDGNFHGLHSFYNVCNRVLKNSASYNIPLNDYVDYIENYYSKKSNYKLKQLYNFEKDYIEKDFKPIQDLILLDLENLKNVTDGQHNVNHYVLKSFGYSTKNKPNSRLDSYKCYNDACTDAHYVAENSKKTKVKNDYLESHPYERKLYEILNNNE